MGKAKRVGLWLRESAKGNKYLSGFDKESSTRYYVFTDNKDPNIRNLASKSEGGELMNIAKLEKRITEKDGEEETFYAADGFFVGDNRYYFNEDGSTTLTKKDGTIVTDKRTGAPLENPSHNLVIG